MPIQHRSYYDASERGRQDRDAGIARQAHNVLMQQDVEQGARVNALMTNPAATADQYARAGRSDVANALAHSQARASEQARVSAEEVMHAAQFGLQSPTPKAFIEKNHPKLVAEYGPDWATATDEQVRAGLQDAIGRFGPQAGVGPAPEPVRWEEVKGPRGSILQRNPLTNEQRQVVGPDNSQPSVGGGAPVGYRFRADGGLEPIPGGPADPNTPSTRDDQRAFAKADKLRDEFNAQSKDFIAVNDAYNQVQAVAATPSAAGDLSMIFSFMKMLDPTSVVREQEFANAQNAAGVPERIQNQYNKLLSGERLNPTQRADFIKQAENLYKTRKSRQDTTVKRYTEIAKRNKVNPDDVIGDLSVAVGNPAPVAGGWSITPIPAGK